MENLIIYVIDKNIATINQLVNNLVNKVNNLYRKWNLRIDSDKCETILFRNTENHLSKIDRENIKKFKVIINIDGQETIIARRQSVKYLGFQMDCLLRLNKHNDIQLQKAKKNISIS